MSEFDRKIIIDAITRMLARREHSYSEIVRKLTQKGIENEAFLPILDAFREADIQSDERFAQSRARALYLKGKGPRVIKLDLQQYGVDEGYVREAFEDIEADWFESAKTAKVKKFGACFSISLPKTSLNSSLKHPEIGMNVSSENLIPSAVSKASNLQK